MRRQFFAASFSLISLFSGSFGSAEIAYADVFQCNHQGTAPYPMLVCSEGDSSDSIRSAWVTLRKMPSWDTHAGLTIIDLCLHDESDNSRDQTLQLVVGDLKQQLVDGKSSGKACKRRYCTDKKKAFSFFLNSVPFPIGWTVVSFRFGQQAHSFSITCDEFRDSNEISAGEQP